MAEFVIADTHFCHANIIKYCERPFVTVDEMNAAMIFHWNIVVSDDDVVYHLGDFAFGPGSHNQVGPILEKLNGYKILLRGNHDRDSNAWYERQGFDKVIGRKQVYKYADGVYMSHAPYPLRPPDIVIHGHIHNNLTIAEPNFICVSVEVINYRPVLIEDLLRPPQ